MARAKNDQERLDEAHFERVIAGMEATPKMTKKDACAILGISYNTTRLDSLIEKYQEKKSRDLARRASLRGKPATAEDTCFVISEYLEGATIDAITKSTFRSAAFVKGILERNAVPIRATSHDYFKPELIPEEAMQERFKVGETVYSARYDSVATIETEQKSNNNWVYRIWLLSEKWRQYAYQEAAELASLEHIRALGVKI